MSHSMAKIDRVYIFYYWRWKWIGHIRRCSHMNVARIRFWSNEFQTICVRWEYFQLRIFDFETDCEWNITMFLWTNVFFPTCGQKTNWNVRNDDINSRKIYSYMIVKYKYSNNIWIIFLYDIIDFQCVIVMNMLRSC